MQGFDGCGSGAIVPRLKSYGRGFQSIICRALRYPPGRMSSAKSIRAELKVEQKQRKKKKCSTAESKIDPHGAESRIKTEKNEKMFYRGVRNRSARS